MRRLGVFASVTWFLVVLAAPAYAAAARSGGGLGHIVVLNGRTEVPAGKTAKNVVVFHGRTVIAGTVTGSVVVFDGATTISGEVDDSVVVFRGAVTVADGARIGGDLVTNTRAQVDPGAWVDGDIKRVSSLRFTSYNFLFHLLTWLAFTVSVLILGLLMVALLPGPMESAALASRSVGATVGWGLITLIGLPMAAVLISITLVGIPLGLSLLLGLWLLFTLAYTVGAFAVGRRILKPPAGRMKAFLVGWVVVRLLGLIPFVGGLMWTLVTLVGLGATTVAIWRSRRVVRTADSGQGAPVGSRTPPPGGVPPPPPTLEA
jgi:hypothetical protein